MAITNTSKKPALEWLFGQNPGAILQQEATGQRELINSAALPMDCPEDLQQKLAEKGVIFGDPLDNDPLFRHAKLPNGWAKHATEHSMWSELRDETGTVQAHIFYKAAFYDRRAFMS